MSRKILFRGKHIHAMDSNEHLNGTWVRGYLSDENHIYDKSLKGEFLIDEDTICQYTGLTDKNGKKIFEGDIVRFGKNYGEVKFGLHESNWQIYKYNQGFFVKFSKVYFRNELGFWRDKVIVTGNIYDNPELLKCCGTCKYHQHENIDDGGVCVNSDSEYVADWICRDSE